MPNHITNDRSITPAYGQATYQAVTEPRPEWHNTALKNIKIPH